MELQGTGFLFSESQAPAYFLGQVAGKENPLAVPTAVLIGIPLYSNAAGTIPVVQALIGKGMPVGTALAFMMSLTALSLPEIIMLNNAEKSAQAEADCRIRRDAVR